MEPRQVAIQPPVPQLAPSVPVQQLPPLPGGARLRHSDVYGGTGLTYPFDPVIGIRDGYGERTMLPEKSYIFDTDEQKKWQRQKLSTKASFAEGGPVTPGYPPGRMGVSEFDQMYGLNDLGLPVFAPQGSVRSLRNTAEYDAMTGMDPAASRLSTVDPDMVALERARAQNDVARFGFGYNQPVSTGSALLDYSAAKQADKSALTLEPAAAPDGSATDGNGVFSPSIGDDMKFLARQNKAQTVASAIPALGTLVYNVFSKRTPGLAPAAIRPRMVDLRVGQQKKAMEDQHARSMVAGRLNTRGMGSVASMALAAQDSDARLKIAGAVEAERNRQEMANVPIINQFKQLNQQRQDLYQAQENVAENAFRREKGQQISASADQIGAAFNNYRNANIDLVSMNAMLDSSERIAKYNAGQIDTSYSDAVTGKTTDTRAPGGQVYNWGWPYRDRNRFTSITPAYRRR